MQKIKIQFAAVTPHFLYDFKILKNQPAANFLKFSPPDKI